MADLVDRVALRTGGNANLLSVKGELITGDGEQAVYLAPGANGTFLMRDDTAPEGQSWQTPGAGGGLTASDGITVALNNATNDLVTGTTVAQVNEQVTGNTTVVTGGNETHTVTGDFSVTGVGADSDISLTSNGATGDIVLSAPGTNATITSTARLTNKLASSGGDVRIEAAGDMVATAGGQGVLDAGGPAKLTGNDVRVIAKPGSGIVIDSTGAAVPAPGEVDIIADTLANIVGTTGVAVTASLNADIGLGVSGTGQITATADDGPIALTCTGDGDIILQKPTVGASVKVGTGITDSNVILETTGASGSIVLTASGAGGGISLTSVQSNVTIDSGNATVSISGGDNDGSGAVTIQPGTNSATRTFAIFDGAGAGQHATIADASGGAVQDAEARTALNSLLAAMRVWGFVDT